MNTPLSQGDARRRIAHLVTEVMTPAVPVAAVILTVAVDSAGALRGLALGLVAIFFAAGIPYGVVLMGVRDGRLTDHHLSRRDQRPPMMAIALASLAAGLLVLRWLDAPRALFALEAGMVAGLTVGLAITSFWKISIHTAAASGTVASLVILVSIWSLILVPLVALIGWARVEIRAHTPEQVLAGALLGSLVTAGALSLVA